MRDDALTIPADASASDGADDAPTTVDAVTPDAPTTVDASTPDPTPDADDAATTADPVPAFRDAYGIAVDALAADPADADALTLVVDAYRAIGSGVTRQRERADAMTRSMSDAMEAPDPAAVLRAAQRVSDALANVAGAGSGTRAERDPADVLAERVALLDVARTVLLESLPAGVDADGIAERVAVIVGSADPADDAMTRRLVRVLAATGSGSRASGKRGAPAAHALAVMASDPARVWTVADIASAASDHYAAGAASDGAVRNALDRLADDGAVVAVTRTPGGQCATVRLADDASDASDDADGAA